MKALLRLYEGSIKALLRLDDDNVAESILKLLVNEALSYWWMRP
jgi:hypothetical protein